MSTSDSPKLYVACLASYNAGTLYGVWIDTADCDDLDDLENAVQAMLSDSPERGEEWAIHDYEGFPMKLGEHESLADVWRWVELLRDHDRDVVTAAAVAFTTDELGDALENFGGVYDQAGEYAEEALEGSYEIPKELAPYIDWKAMEHDMECNGEVTCVEHEGRRYYFRCW